VNTVFVGFCFSKFRIISCSLLDVEADNGVGEDDVPYSVNQSCGYQLFVTHPEGTHPACTLDVKAKSP